MTAPQAGPHGLIVMSDCLNDPVAQGEISAHYYGLAGCYPQLLALPPALGRHEHIKATALASHALYRILRATTQHMGQKVHSQGIAVNGAPRNGDYPNGVPFCYFHKRGNIVTAPYDPQVLRMVRREFGVNGVYLVDVETVLRASRSWGVDLSEDSIQFIAQEKFRSLWFQLRFNLWLMQGHQVPGKWVPTPVPADDDRLRISFVDGFGNAFFNHRVDELGLEAGDTVRLPEFVNGHKVDTHDVKCCHDFADLREGEPGLILGYTYPMLVVSLGRADQLFGYTHGQAIELRRTQQLASA